jgi:outer membrane murein-binding lipoprotein Lpp
VTTAIVASAAAVSAAGDLGSRPAVVGVAADSAKDETDALSSDADELSSDADELSSDADELSSGDDEQPQSGFPEGCGVATAVAAGLATSSSCGAA